MRKIQVIVNKSWEAEPVIEALVNAKFKSSDLPAPLLRVSPRPYTRGAVHVPRLVFEIAEVVVEVWCLEDQMDAAVNGSSTSEKARVLPAIFNSVDEIALVIAVGTAGTPTPGFNGWVMVGDAFFMHPGTDPSNTDPWSGNIGTTHYFDRLLSREIPRSVYPAFAAPADLAKKFLKPPREPSPAQEVRFTPSSIAVSDVNIIDYRLYNTQDPLALAAAEGQAGDRPILSLETTHGVIAAAALHYTSATIAFVTAVTDSLGHFDTDVGPQPESQNFSAAFNAGVYLGNVLVPMANAIPASG